MAWFWIRCEENITLTTEHIIIVLYLYKVYVCLMTLKNLMQHWCFKDEEWVHVIQGLLWTGKCWRVCLWQLSSFRFFLHCLMSRNENSHCLLLCHVSVCSCMRSFQKVKREHGALRQKLEAYFQVIIRHKSHPSFCTLCHEPWISVCVNTRSCYDKLVLLELPPGLECKN